MGKSRKSLTRESRRVHSGQWSQKLQALQRGGDRSGPRLGGEPGSREAGGKLPEVQVDWQTRMRGGGALGEELTGRQNRQRADWAARKELDQIWPLIGLSRRRSRGRCAREGGRGSRAGLPESRSGYERGGSASQLRPGVTLRSAALQPGVSGREARRREAGAGSRAEGSKRAALPPGPRRVLRAPGARGSAARALCGRIAGRRDGEPGTAKSCAQPAGSPRPGRARRHRPGRAAQRRLLSPPSWPQLLLQASAAPSAAPTAPGRWSPAR